MREHVMFLTPFLVPKTGHLQLPSAIITEGDPSLGHRRSPFLSRKRIRLRPTRTFQHRFQHWPNLHAHSLGWDRRVVQAGFDQILINIAYACIRSTIGGNFTTICITYLYMILQPVVLCTDASRREVHGTLMGLWTVLISALIATRIVISPTY